jgi:hypothetical protein
MGACFSSPQFPVGEEEKRLHKQAEQQLKEVRSNFGLIPLFTKSEAVHRQRLKWPRRLRCDAYPYFWLSLLAHCSVGAASRIGRLGEIHYLEGWPIVGNGELLV